MWFALKNGGEIIAVIRWGNPEGPEPKDFNVDISAWTHYEVVSVEVRELERARHGW